MPFPRYDRQGTEPASAEVASASGTGWPAEGSQDAILHRGAHLQFSLTSLVVVSAQHL